MDINSNLENLKNKNDIQQKMTIKGLSKEEIKLMLDTISGNKISNKLNRKYLNKKQKKIALSKNNNSLSESFSSTSLSDKTNDKDNILDINLKKPFWIDNVKIIHKKYFPDINLKEMESDIFEDRSVGINYQTTDNKCGSLISNPFYTGIKKLLYAFGDLRNSDNETVNFVQKQTKNFFINMIKIINKCDYDKVIPYLFEKEFHHYNKFAKNKNFGEFKDENILKDYIDFSLVSDDNNKKKNNRNIMYCRIRRITKSPIKML